MLGGVAVHEHCAGMAVCRRDHADLDLAGLRRQMQPVVEVFGALDAAPKALAWRLRARVGTRRHWWDIVEEQVGPTS